MTINYEQVDNVIRDIIFTINALKAANNQLESEISRLSNCNGTEENSHDHSSQIRRMKEIININTKMIQQLEIICNGLSNFKSDVFKKDIDLSRLFENNDLLEKIMQRVIPSYECSCEDEQVLTDKETTNGEELVEGMGKEALFLEDEKMKQIYVSPDFCFSQLGKTKDRNKENREDDWWSNVNGEECCAATGLATMLSINKGCIIYPTQIEIDENSNVKSWDENGVKIIQGNEKCLEQISENLNNGKATLVNSGTHWVTVIGLQDKNNAVVESNLIIIDPWDGEMYNWTVGKNGIGDEISRCVTEK